MKKEDRIWRITFKGLVDNDAIYEKVKSYMERHNFNAIVLNDGYFSFEKVEESQKPLEGV